jgi:hypothetical protein
MLHFCLTMQSFKWLVLTIVLLAVQRGESGITIDSATCAGTLSGKIQAGLTDMGNIARLAYGCTADLQSGAATSACNSQVVLSTFQAYFGSVTDGDLASRGAIVLCTCFCHFAHMQPSTLQKRNRMELLWAPQCTPRGCEW